MTGSPIDVPAVPSLAPAIIDQHRRVHIELSGRLDAAHQIVRRAFVHLSSRLIVEGLAKLQPVLADVHRPLLIPPPRRFLSRQLTQRRAGAAAAFRHIDSKIAMIQAGSAVEVIEPSTPEVLNALLQGPVLDTPETNPGLVRATSTNWAPESNTFEHPPAASCRRLLEQTVDTVRSTAAAPVEIAGWLAFTLMTIHPFVDGNGRTARACAQAILSLGLPHDADWGLLEQWCLARTDYLDALRAGQRSPAYAADAVDPLPFMEFTATSSARGARLSLARLSALAAIAEELAARGLSDDAVSAVLTVVVDRSVAPSGLAMAVTGADTPEAAALDIVEDLVRNSFLAWTPRSAGSDPAEHSGDVSVVPGPRIADIANTVTHLRFSPAQLPH